MSVIKTEDIVGYWVGNGNETICADCATEEESEEAKLDDIITEDDLRRDDDRLIFCDRCKEKIAY